MADTFIRVEDIKASIAEYKMQFDTLQTQIAQLEKNYNDQRTLAVNTLNQILGAMSGLETLLGSVKAPAQPPTE